MIGIYEDHIDYNYKSSFLPQEEQFLVDAALEDKTPEQVKKVAYEYATKFHDKIVGNGGIRISCPAWDEKERTLSFLPYFNKGIKAWCSDNGIKIHPSGWNWIDKRIHLLIRLA